MSLFDDVAVRLEVSRRAAEADHRARCRCGHPRLMHQFDDVHQGSCTTKKCPCRVFSRA